MQLSPSRESNILDLYLTTYPSLVKSCYTEPDISDPHDQLLLQQDLAALETLAGDLGMRFIVSKCHLMSIHRSKHPHSSHYKLDNHILEQVEENPYLGVTIHKGLKLASNINKVSNKANSVLGFIQHNP